jgi:hypothetical protein
MMLKNSKFNCNTVLSEVLVAAVAVLMTVNFNCIAVTARPILVCYIV